MLRLILVAVILSMLSLSLIFFVHLALISVWSVVFVSLFVSLAVCCLFWMTLSHRMTQTRWAASDSTCFWKALYVFFLFNSGGYDPVGIVSTMLVVHLFSLANLARMWLSRPDTWPVSLGVRGVGTRGVALQSGLVTVQEACLGFGNFIFNYIT